MQRGPLFLAAALLEVLRFFSLMLFAEAIGLVGTGSLAPSFLRYLAVPQLLFAAVFFFLWFDGQRYAEYRPLAVAGSIVSLLALVPILLAIVGSLGGEGFVPLPGLAFSSVIVIVSVDVFALLTLGFYRRGAAVAGRARRGSEPGASPDPAAASQRGPEDIEKVEDLT